MSDDFYHALAALLGTLTALFQLSRLLFTWFSERRPVNRLVRRKPKRALARTVDRTKRR
jgi:hypothetical protein